MNWSLNKDGYLCAKINRKHTYQHRYIWEQHNGPIPDGMFIHHINGIKDDNRIENLALVTHKQNHQKMDRAGKGYHYSKRHNKYQAKRKVNDVYKHIGLFSTACGAYIASRMAYITHS